MAITYHFDLYPRTNPSGTRLVRFTNLQAAEYRGEANGSGAGRFSIRATDAEAAFIDPDGLQYVRVIRDNGATELVVGGFFLESGEYDALTETSTKLLSYGGAGTLSYLGRAVMDADSWINDPFIGTDPQPDGTWPLHLAGTGNELGAILWRVLHELEEPGRHQDPVPLMTLGFTHLLDSNGASWVQETGDFVAQVSDTVLSIIRRLMQLGLYVEVDPDDFEVRAYEPGTHRRDRTGGAWGTNVVRFQSPTDGTIATGNIKSDARRALEAKIRRNALLVGMNDTWEWVDDPAVTVPWEGGYILEDEDGGSLSAAGAAQLTARSEAGDVLRLRFKLGESPTTGSYLPFEHVRLDDLVTVHTGTGQWDYNEAEFPVAALTISLRPGGDWDAWADLGSVFFSTQERAFQAQPVGHHTHPPNPRLCPPADLLRGLTALKGSGEQTIPGPAPMTAANDGDDSTPWGSGQGEPVIGVAGEWWAADLGEPSMVGTYRIRQQGGGSPNIQNVATTVGIYGTVDDALWTALPASGKLTDPEVDGWRLLATYTGALAFSDVRADFTPGGARYVIFWAEAGGTLDWDVETFELWSYVGTSPYAAHCDHEHSPTEEDAAVAAGNGANLWHLEREHRLRIIAHRGDVNLVDGYPENTIEGIRQAALRGADGVEFDVVPSSDGTWHLMHDLDVSRTTDGTGNINSKTDAAIAALNIDGGVGYDAGRHGTSLNVPTLDDVLDAIRPYNFISVLHLNAWTDDTRHELLAEYVVAAGITDRVIILASSLSGAAAIKAVDSDIQVQTLTFVTDDPQSEADVDQWLAVHTELSSLSTVTGKVPEQVWSLVNVSEIPADETPWIQEAWDYGAVGFMTNSLPEALAYRERITMRGRYEPVVEDEGSGPEIVFDAGDIVMQWVNT